MEEVPDIGGSTTDAGFRLTGNKRGRIPASSEAILGLREVAVPTDGSDCCAICLQEFDADDASLRAMPCSHAFHQDCIFRWLRRSAACPLCRHQLPTEEEEEEEEEQVPRSRWVRYNEDGEPYTRISFREEPLLADVDDEELDEEQLRERRRVAEIVRQGLARWHNLFEPRTSQSSTT